MKIELKDTSAVNKELHIEISPETIKEVYQKVCKKFARMASIPGFRKGFAPVDVVKLRYAEDIKNEVFRDLLPHEVAAAFEELKMDPLGEPHMHIENVETVKVNGSQSIMLQVHFEILPEIKDINYKKIEGTRRVRPVNEDELDHIIDERRQETSVLTPVENRKSKTGDTVIVDLEGLFPEKPEEVPIKADDLKLTLGEANIEPAFSENLVGLNEDEEKEFTVEYPADYQSKFLAGQKVNYKAKVKTIGVLEIPAADDEWAKSLEEEFESMKDLRGKLRDDLERVARLESDNKLRDEILTKLIDSHQIEVPFSLVQIQAKNLVENFANEISQQGVDLNGMDQDFIKTIFQQFQGQAEKDVRGALLLEKVAELEKIDATSEEVAAEIEKMAMYYRVSPEEIRASLTKQGSEKSIADRLRSRKAVEAIIDLAVIKEGEWIDEKAIAESPEEADKPKKKEKKTEPKPKKTRKKAE